MAWSNATIVAVWCKGAAVFGSDPGTWRKDSYGHYIRFGDYAHKDSDYGWEIDHIYPVSKGGSDSLSNLQPLNWRSNAYKSDRVLRY